MASIRGAAEAIGVITSAKVPPAAAAGPPKAAERLMSVEKLPLGGACCSGGCDWFIVLVLMADFGKWN